MSEPAAPRVTPWRSRLAVRDVVTEASAAIGRRAGRSLLTALGTVVGVGAVVATTGLASTARAQVGEAFDALKATEVRVVDARPDGTNPFPGDVEIRLARLNGVNEGGVYWTIENAELDVRSLPTPSRRPANTPVIAASPGAVRAARPTLAAGVLYDEFHDGRGERVALLGRVVAEQLGINRTDNQPAVFVGDAGYTVVGIINDVDRNPEMLLAVVIPAGNASPELSTTNAEYQVLIDVDAGAADVVGDQAANALHPQDPARLQVLVPPDPRQLRRQIEDDVTNLLYGLAGLALLVGMIGIANTTLVAVLERRNEIGVRRALGARRRHIAAQILTESAALGTLGGVLGASMGIVAVVAVSVARDWTTTLDPRYVLLAPLLGALTGLLAGLQPAWRASRIAPAGALRAE